MDWADKTAEDLLCQWTQYAKEYQTTVAFDPVQLAAAFRRVREDALEEAAKFGDGYAGSLYSMMGGSDERDAVITLTQCIRALKEK